MRMIGPSVLAALLLAWALPALAQGVQTYDGYTKPSRELKLPFYGQGLIREVNVKRGDSVKAGQVLMAQDDRIERKALEALLIEANSELAIEARRLELEQKKVELARVEDMYNRGRVASQIELEKARLDVQIGELAMKNAQEERERKKLEAARQQDKVQLMSLLAPIDGQVQELGLDVGEFCDPQNMNKPACVLVQNDPLRVEVHLPSSVTRQLKLGQELQVRYADSQQWQPARIIFFDPVADARSGTQRLHLEMPNPEKHWAGMQVQVRLPENLAKSE